MADGPLNALDRDRFLRLPLDKILFGIGVIYLGSVLVWLQLQQRFPWSARQSGPSAHPSSGNRLGDDRQFAEYLQQSLQTLDRNEKSTAAASTSNSTTPANSASNSQLPAPSLVERIYLPPQNLPVPIATAPATSLPSVSPAQPKSQKVAIAPMPRPLPPPPAPTPSRPSPPPAITASHSLVGLLASGEQSTVLVTANGTTRRFAIGEAIGNSGWILVDVNRDRALISRQGTSKAVEVGQSF